MDQVRQIIYYKDHFLDFYNLQSEKVKGKIDFVLFVVKVAERIPQKFFKYLTGTDGLFEIRVELQHNIYRIFCCFDDGNLVVLFNGFQKKSEKTPQEEIEKALKLKNKYFHDKYKNKKK